MTRKKTWILTDAHGDIWLDSFTASNDSLRLPTIYNWSVRKRTLKGGLRDGIDLIEVNNGALSFSIIPTRGMALWRGDYRGIRIGWNAPIQGPVHPKFVNLADRGGLGWLAGFDELLCRCGLAFNGPPGQDRGQPITLHGRIANIPASVVEVSVSLDPPYEISVNGEVDEGALFFGRLRLRTIYSTVPGSNRIVITDRVENLAAQPAEMQLLYHCNFGPPLLGAGSRVLVPIREMAPLTNRAAEGIQTYDTYSRPTPGFAEQVYVYTPAADSKGNTLALLTNADADKGVCLRWNISSLPCFTVWKNSLPLEEGYVTGLEPATGYPNFKTFERDKGRVQLIPPGGRWEAHWSIEATDTSAGVLAMQTEVASIQAHVKPLIHLTPQPNLTASL